MHLKELQPGVILKRSPFLVVKQLSNREVRVYSKLHGNLTTFDFDVEKFLKCSTRPRRFSRLRPG